MPELAIDARALTRRFKETVAVVGLSLDVPVGGLFGLVGADGAGKSTLIRMLATVLAPTSGDADIFGHSIVHDAHAIKGRIGYMSQRFSLYGDLSVRENILFFADVYRVPQDVRARRLAELLAFSRLTDFQGRRAEHLSGGMKQKLALACTLIHQPEVLFLDEPTTGVDPVSRREFWRILYDLLKRGVTLFVSTPYMDEAERCNTVGFLAQGRLLVSGAPAELKSRLANGEMLELKGLPRKVTGEIARRTAGVQDVQIFGDRLHIRVDDAATAMPRVRESLTQAGVEIVTLRQIKPSMEDVFVSLSAPRPS